MSASDDLAAVEELRAGESRGFDQLMRRHGPAVFRYAWAIADSPEQVDDLVQETFLTLWRRRKHITLVGGSLLPWLLTTCRFTAFNSNRRQRRSAALPLEAIEHSSSAASNPADHDPLRWVADEVAQLTAIDQRLLDACVTQGRPYAEAASELGISPPAARKRMERIRTRLRAAQINEEAS